MRGLKKFLYHTITIPLLAVPIAAAAPKYAYAAISSPTQALELLAKSKEVEAKCQKLASSERQELSDYTARAELAVARRKSVADAQAAITIGKSKGRAAACNDASLTEVRETLTAARAAMANLAEQTAENDDGLVIENKAATKMRPSLIEPVAPAVSMRIKPIEQTIEKPAVERPRKRDALRGYRDALTAYYVELRCGHLSRSQARQFWNQIVERHNQLLANNSRRAVATTLRSASATASRMPCGIRTAEMVRQGYASIRTP
jgi:hypothetical protein